jgi:nicotinate-nucleotide adenylyltransferase
MPDPVAPIGILGGTFDPIHYGHLRLAEEAADACALARVLLIPAALPNLRSAPRTAAHHRLQMARLAAQDNARLHVDGRELRRKGVSYTVDTLEELRAEFGATQPLWLILGADAFLRLPAWNRWMRLFDLAHIVVAARPGYDLAAAMAQSAELAAEWRARMIGSVSGLGEQPFGAIASIQIPLLEISASEIRARIVRGVSVRYMAPQTVLDYIAAEHLYEVQ